MSQVSKTKPAPSPFTGMTSPYLVSYKPYGEWITGETRRTDPLRQNPCSHTRVACLVSSGACYERYIKSSPFWPSRHACGAGYALFISGYLGIGKTPTMPSNTALHKCYEKYADQLAKAGRSDLQVISFVREMSKTVSMLKNPFSLVTAVTGILGKKGAKRCRNVPFGDLVKAGPGTVRLVAKKRIHPKSQSFKDAVDKGAGTWLEGTYGWQPFLNDVVGALPGLHVANQARKQLKQTGDRSFSYPVTHTAQASYGAALGGKPFYVKSGDVFLSTKARLYGTWTVNPSVGAENALHSMLRATNIDRLGYALWDAVPYSFVFDWFLPIGNIVDNALSGPTFYINATSPWLSEKVKTTRSFAIAASTGSFGGTYYSGAATYVEVVEDFTRGPCDIGRLSVQAKGMHGTRVASGFALAWGAISRRLR